MIHIDKSGSVEAVKKSVAAFGTDGKVPTGTDPGQIDDIKTFVAAELGRMKSNGCRVHVEASTQQDGTRTVQINIYPMQLEL